MTCLYVKNQTKARIARAAAGIFVALGFVFAGAYESLGTLQSMPYVMYVAMDINAWLMLFGYGLLSYLIYYLLSGFAYNIGMNTCMRLTGIYNVRPIDRGTFRLNLDVCYGMANLVIGAINVVYFFYPWARPVGGTLIAPIVVAGFMTLFYFMIRSKIGKSYYFPLLSGLGLPFLVMLVLV